MTVVQVININASRAFRIGPLSNQPKQQLHTILGWDGSLNVKQFVQI